MLVTADKRNSKYAYHHQYRNRTLYNAIVLASLLDHLPEKRIEGEDTMLTKWLLGSICHVNGYLMVYPKARDVTIHHSEGDVNVSIIEVIRIKVGDNNSSFRNIGLLLRSFRIIFARIVVRVYMLALRTRVLRMLWLLM